MTQIFMMRPMIMAASPWCMKKEGDGLWAGSQCEAEEDSIGCLLAVEVVPCLHPDGIMMIWALVVDHLHPHQAEEDVGAVGPEICLCLHHHHLEEGKRM